MISAKIIKKLIEKKPDKIELNEFLAKSLAEIENIKKEIRVLENKKIEAQKICDEKIKEINLKIKEIKKNCHHYDEQFYPDPSGNNDSYYCCTICGRER